MKTTKRNRRPVNPAQQWRPELITIVDATGATPTTAGFSLSGPMFGGNDTMGWIVQGGSGTRDVDQAVLSEAGTELEVSWVSPLASGDYSLIIPAWDEGYRTQAGGYLAPVTFGFNIS